MTNNVLAADGRLRPPRSSTRGSMGLGRAIAAKVTKVTVLGAMLAAAFVALLPSAASANCEVPEVSDVPVNPYSPFEIGNTRSSLNAGVDVGGAYYAEPFYNWGGTDEGGEYQGVLELYVNANMQKLGLWRGLCFHANGYQIHGNSITGANIGGLMPVTSLEAEDATRLFEIWFEQSMFNDRVSVRFGQLAADEEFFAADGGGYFINGSWGWSPIAAENNPNGGPAYPLATPGVRVSWDATDNLNLKVGVYNGDPAPQCNKAGGDPQRCNDHGLDFELDDDPLLMAEATYGYELAGGRLPGVLRIGGWNHFGTFQHQRVDVGGNLIAITGNDGRPLDNDWALYGIIDQLIWRVPGSEDPHGVAVFARFAGAPDDRNLVDFYFDAGFTFTGMMASRPNDALAIGFAYTGISDEVSAFDVDTGAVAARDYESLIEIAYTFQVNEWWVLQPDFQYIWNPAGEPGLDDATVVGARSTMTF